MYCLFISITMPCRPHFDFNVVSWCHWSECDFNVLWTRKKMWFRDNSYKKKTIFGRVVCLGERWALKLKPLQSLPYFLFSFSNQTCNYIIQQKIKGKKKSALIYQFSLQLASPHYYGVWYTKACISLYT